MATKHVKREKGVALAGSWSLPTILDSTSRFTYPCNVSSIRLEAGQNRGGKWKGGRLEGRKGRTQLIPLLGLYYISWLRYQASQQPTSRLSAFVPIHLLPITAPSRPGYAAQPRPLIGVPHFHPYSPISSPSPFPFPPCLCERETNPRCLTRFVSWLDQTRFVAAQCRITALEAYRKRRPAIARKATRLTPLVQSLASLLSSPPRLVLLVLLRVSHRIDMTRTFSDTTCMKHSMSNVEIAVVTGHA